MPGANRLPPERLPQRARRVEGGCSVWRIQVCRKFRSCQPETSLCGRHADSYNSCAMNKRMFAYLLSPLCLVLPLSLLMTDASAIPATPNKPLLVATNQGDRSLSIIDPAADKQLAAVPEGGVTG